jgi:hypothetical protein
LGTVLALLAAAPVADAQPIRRVTGLDDPFSGVTERTDAGLPTMSPVPPRTAYQPPQPDRDPSQPDFVLPDGAPIPVPQSKPKVYNIGSRYGTRLNLQSQDLDDGTSRILATGGLLLSVASTDGSETTEFATDNAVIWRRGAGAKAPLNGQVTEGDGKTAVEVYLSGFVIIRTARGKGTKRVVQTLRAEEVYYDAENNRAIAIRGDLEMALPNSVDPFHMRGDEVRRLDLENWEILQGSASASKLPSDPGLRFDSQRFTLSERRTIRRNIFGIPFRDLLTGEVVEYQEQLVTGKNVITRLGGVPVFYQPVLQLDATDPLGPLQSFGFSQARQFGPSFYTTWDLFELLALRPPPGQTLRLNADYMQKRGPATGIDYTYRVPGDSPTDLPRGAGWIKVYGINDNGDDLLGGNRGPEPVQPINRGRVMWRHQQSIGDEFYFQGQLGLLSDKNFLEQYYKNEFDMGPNQETFAYLTWQRRNFGASALVEDRFARQWVTETNHLPEVRGHLIGQTFLDDLFVYSARGSATYAQLLPTKDPPYALLPTEQRDSTGRFDLWQELSVPFALGPVKLAPYGVLELTDYTSDLNGNEIGRVYGGGGERASLPFSRLYDDVSSDLLNVRGIYHKIVFGANYLYARTNVPFSKLPLLDRLNDDATDQAYRNITPFQSQLVPGLPGLALMNSPSLASQFNPQLYAIRRLVENRIDTLDNMDVLQADVRQRFQTKRGYPGMEHIVDVLTLDVSASYFPEARRDDFGHPFAFLEYAALWNAGDRTAVVSNGWFEPYQGGSRYWTLGAYLNRTDRTNLYLGYRQTDPLRSKAVTLGLSYQLSHRYFLTTSVTYDFGIQAALSNSLMLTRTGTDMTVSMGFTYTAFVNSFGFQFLVIPNLASALNSRYANALASGAPLGRR